MKRSDPLAGFKLKGVPLNLAAEPAAVFRLRAKLDAMPRGELVATRDAAVLAGIGNDKFTHHAPHPALRPYRAMVPPRTLVWGNPKTIQDLKRRLGDHR